MRITLQSKLLGFAECPADAGLVVYVAHTNRPPPKGRSSLARVFGRELFHLRVDHNETAQPQMVEQQIDVEILTPYAISR